MFLVEDQQKSVTCLVFTWEDPRREGYTGRVVEGVSLDYDMHEVHDWPDGEDAPEACVGRAKDDPKQFKVFKYCRELAAAGYNPVEGTPLLFGLWSDYLRARHPALLDDERWYKYLDRLDEESRERRLTQAAPQLAGKSRDEVAAWLAQQHFIVDSGLREVWYLPRGAPADEIRLLEANDRLAGAGESPEPIDFGLDVEGAPYRLFVADVTSDQLDQIRLDPSRLPSGWSLEGNRVWRRGA